MSEVSQRLVYETHMHTPLCNHAIGEVEDYAAVAEQRGLAGIIVTCHNPLPDGYSQSVRMREDQFDEYVAMVERARQAYAGRVEVWLGLECDYAPGFEKYLEQQVKMAPFEHLLGSIHPQVAEYRECFDPGNPGDPTAFQKVYFDHLACAAETGFFHTLSHPDLIKNFTAAYWDPQALREVIEHALDRIAATGCAMELNTSGLSKTIREMNPCPMMLREMKQRNIPVVVGADAHEPGRVAGDYEQAYDLLEQTGYEQVSYFLHGQRHDLPIPHARASLHTQSRQYLY